MGKSIKKPHAVCIPFPAQSHVNAMLKFAKILHHKGFHITFVHTEYNYNRILKTRGPNAFDGLMDFKFETIPDGLPPAETDDATQDAFELGMSTAGNNHAPFLQLLRNLNHKATASADHGDSPPPPVTCVISDCLMSFTLQASEELGIPTALFSNMNGNSALCYQHYLQLDEQGYIPFEDQSRLTNEYLNQTIDWIPGAKSVRLRDLPIIWTPDDALMKYMVDLTPSIIKGSALIMNTFDTLEHDVLRQYSAIVDNHLYTVGPVHMLGREIQEDDGRISTSESIQSNLWKEDDSCIEWLNSKKQGSVAYVNFGSLAVVTKDQLVEFAWGLANSMHKFLWIIRPDLVPEGAVLPAEFIEATKGRGMLSTWCNQELVLNHPSVGVFLTHCGGKSVVETLSAGVVLICLPYFGDQLKNCVYCSVDGVVEVETANNVDRVEVEKVVRELMEGEKGMEMKKEALEWKKKAEEAVRPGVGSSYLNLDKLIQEVLLQPKTKSLPSNNPPSTLLHL